jgi:hypothetical protein
MPAIGADQLINIHKRSSELTSWASRCSVRIRCCYDPLSPSLKVCKGDQEGKVALNLLMKCHYGDNAHVQENEEYYTSPTSTSLQEAVHNMWKKINTLGSFNALQVRWMNVPLTLSRYLFINDKNSMGNMSVQLTGNGDTNKH